MIITTMQTVLWNVLDKIMFEDYKIVKPHPFEYKADYSNFEEQRLMLLDRSWSVSLLLNSNDQQSIHWHMQLTEQRSVRCIECHLWACLVVLLESDIAPFWPDIEGHTRKACMCWQKFVGSIFINVFQEMSLKTEQMLILTKWSTTSTYPYVHCNCFYM